MKIAGLANPSSARRTRARTNREPHAGGAYTSPLARGATKRRLAAGGQAGYDDLRRQAVTVSIACVEIQMAALGNIIRSKSALLREKDMETLQVLRELEQRHILDDD